jgi:hypothetical protein
MSSSSAETEATSAGPAPFGLLWAIKPSFISYVSRMPDGKAYLGGGVGVNKDNELLFPFSEEATGEAAPAEAERVFRFGGEVVFRAHFGMLSVQISRLQVHLRGTGGELSVVDPEAAEGGRLTLVTFTATGPGIRDGAQYWAADDVRLTEAGVPLFGDVYPADEPFAPLMIAIPSPLSAPGDHHH